MKDKLKRIIHIMLREEKPPEPVIAMLFDNEKSFLDAVRNITHIEGLNAVTPYPVHGLEDLLKLKRSWLPWVTFIAGSFGLTFGLWFTWWTSVVSWPLNIGGKPLFSLPAFIPIAFEFTILFAALSTVISLFYVCGLPKVNPPVLDSDLTCHKFAIYAPISKNDIQAVRVEWSKIGAEIIEGSF